MWYNITIMKRNILIILTLFLFFINTCAYAAPSVTKKEYRVPAQDKFNLKATLTYPKIKTQKEFSTVVLLHSIGYNSQWWGELPKELLNKGYAVLTVDLRGHGESVYNSRLSKVSWKSMKNSAYAKMPDDILKIMQAIKDDNTRRTFFNNWAIVGSDLGANVGVIASDKSEVRPKTIVMISPVVETKGLYIPVNLAHLDNTDVLSIKGKGDTDAAEAEKYLARFVQAQLMGFTSESKTKGMLMLKNDPDLPKMISEWISEYLN